MSALGLCGNPDTITAQIALGRIGEPDHKADIVAFLTSHDARCITGPVIDAAGGSRL